MTENTDRRKPIVGWLIRLIAATGLIIYLIASEKLDFRMLAERKIHYEFIILALLVYTLTNLKGIVRWKILLLAVGIKTRFLTILRLTYLGHIFSIMLPGVVGGDAVKAILLHREQKERFSISITSAFGDRIIGTIAMLALIISVAPFLERSALLKSQTLAILFVLAIIFAVSLVLFLFSTRLEKPLKRLFIRLPFRRFTLRVIIASFTFRRKFFYSLIAFLISLPAHILSVVAVLCCIKAIGFDAPFLPLTYAVLVGLLIEALPISIAGFGVGEQAFEWLFSVLLAGGVATAGAEVALLMHLTRIFAAAPGLVFLFISKRTKKIT